MLSKKKQTSHNRIKQKPMACKHFMAWVHNVCRPKCFACGGNDSMELHHIKKSSSDLKDDSKVLPLCGNKCHRLGTELSAHGTPKKFREVFPIAVQLAYAEKLYEQYLTERWN